MSPLPFHLLVKVLWWCKPATLRLSHPWSKDRQEYRWRPVEAIRMEAKNEFAQAVPHRLGDPSLLVQLVRVPRFLDADDSVFIPRRGSQFKTFLADRNMVFRRRESPIQPGLQFHPIHSGPDLWRHLLCRPDCPEHLVDRPPLPQMEEHGLRIDSPAGTLAVPAATAGRGGPSASAPAARRESFAPVRGVWRGLRRGRSN